MLKDIAIVTSGVLAGNFVAEAFVLKSGPDDPTGFIMVADGLGLDDLARAAVCTLFVLGIYYIAG